MVFSNAQKQTAVSVLQSVTAPDFRKQLWRRPEPESYRLDTTSARQVMAER